jgi:DNA-binding GntR family transcriptional regulator
MWQIVDNLQSFLQLFIFSGLTKTMDDTETLDVLKQHSMPSLVQSTLERMIYSGGFLPGAPLREASLAAHMGVSRGPIREAFRALAEKGLVRTEKNRGVFVRTLTPHEADEIFEVRSALEHLIVMRLSSEPERLKNSDIPKLLTKAKHLAANEDVAGCHHLSLLFHDRLAELTGNATLHQAYRRLMNGLALFRAQSRAQTHEVATLRQSVNEHAALFSALVAGDEFTALRLLRQHVASSRERIRQSLKKSTEALQ